jgi:protoporphyrinogen oxidase
MSTETQGTAPTVVIGAGPAGLTAAYALARRGAPVSVLEQGARVGGLARTEEYRGFHFDIGGHRFFTKVPEVARLWREVLGPDFLRRPRLSRIFYNGRYVRYPLRPWNALRSLGVGQALLVIASYLRWQVLPYRREDTFEHWVTNRFGQRLFRVFFKTYTEKVWGIPCTELKAEWAAQRIKDLSLRTAIMGMLVRPRSTITTLIEEFDYPRRGPGMMWEAVRSAVERDGGTVALRSPVVAVRREGARVTGVDVERGGRRETIAAGHVVSSMPITELVARLDPPAPPEVRAAAAMLRHRDFLTVCLVIDRADLFPDNWIYVHDPGVRVGRIQNFKNWSPDMVPDPGKTSLGFEYFCNEGDDVWCMPDADLVALAAREVEVLRLARRDEVVDGCVVRAEKAYPIYDASYREQLARVRGYLEGFENLQTIGRNGLHRYDNQDHAMLTGLLAAENLLDGARHDVWTVNADAAYHEEIQAEEVAPETLLVPGFAKLDRVAFGVATGLVAGLGLWLATIALVLKGGPVVGPHLSLLAQYLPGYTVTVTGGFLGLAYGMLGGFVGGWTFALLRNASALVALTVVRRRVERRALGRLLDYV